MAPAPETLSFEISDLIPADPETVYRDWLDSAGHAAMTGGPAEASDAVGGSFTAWGDYISGTNVELEVGRRIVQNWRTSEFTDAESDSRLEILLEAAEGGCKITLIHTGLPEHGMQYKQGWVDHYFEPMKQYYGSGS